MNKNILFSIYRPFQIVYRFLVPKPTRKKIETFLFGVSKPKLRRKIIRYLEGLPKDSINPEQLEVLEFLRKNPLQIFPYRYTKDYDMNSAEPCYDDSVNLYYVLFEGKRLYFKRSWTKERIKTIYNNLLIEQHPDSPHRYLSGAFDVDNGDIIADIGVAEGNFALSVIEKAAKVYLFESDEEWIECLKATFAPWKGKVTIVNKWVSAVDDENFVTLDTYFTSEKPDFIKIDVDGFEAKLLKGCQRIINESKDLKLALCTYHKQDDHDVFSDYLTKKGFHLTSSKGYMLFYWGGIKKPYLRRGVLRATQLSHE
jgi:hypothetical protein